MERRLLYEVWKAQQDAVVEGFEKAKAATSAVESSTWYEMAMHGQKLADEKWAAFVNACKKHCVEDYGVSADDRAFAYEHFGLSGDEFGRMFKEGIQSIVDMKQDKLSRERDMYTIENLMKEIEVLKRLKNVAI